MTREQLVADISVRASTTPETAGVVLHTLFDAVKSALRAGDTAALGGLGTWIPELNDGAALENVLFQPAQQLAALSIQAGIPSLLLENHDFIPSSVLGTLHEEVRQPVDLASVIDDILSRRGTDSLLRRQASLSTSSSSGNVASDVAITEYEASEAEPLNWSGSGSAGDGPRIIPGTKTEEFVIDDGGGYLKIPGTDDPELDETVDGAEIGSHRAEELFRPTEVEFDGSLPLPDQYALTAPADEFDALETALEEKDDLKTSTDSAFGNQAVHEDIIVDDFTNSDSAELPISRVDSSDDIVTYEEYDFDAPILEDSSSLETRLSDTEIVAIEDGDGRARDGSFRSDISLNERSEKTAEAREASDGSEQAAFRSAAIDENLIIQHDEVDQRELLESLSTLEEPRPHPARTRKRTEVFDDEAVILPDLPGPAPRERETKIRHELDPVVFERNRDQLFNPPEEKSNRMLFIVAAVVTALLIAAILYVLFGEAGSGAIPGDELSTLHSAICSLKQLA